MPNQETIEPQKPDMKCTPDPTKVTAHRQGVGVENVRGKAYGEATGLYNKHCKYSEQWYPWHPFQSAHNFQQAQLFSQQMITWIDQHLRGGLDSFKNESFQSADALRKLLTQLDFGLGHDCWIEDYSPIFGTLYYRDIFQYIWFHLTNLPFQAHHDFEPVCIANSGNHRVYVRPSLCRVRHHEAVG